MHTEIIPAINSKTFADVAKKIDTIKNFTQWIHLDIADGTFTKNMLWHNPSDLAEYLLKNPNILVEVHLMIQNPEAVVVDWIRAGAKRIIVHVETINDFLVLKRATDNAGAFLMLSLAPETPASALDPYFEGITGFQVLAVHPGFPGQLFQENTYDKIKYIRQKCPYCDLEVDGGVKPGIAQKCQEAGANHIAAASAIIDAQNPLRALDELKKDVQIKKNPST
jgi:ribulose-phosphate 3-epimerase